MDKYVKTQILVEREGRKGTDLVVAHLHQLEAPLQIDVRMVVLI